MGGGTSKFVPPESSVVVGPADPSTGSGEIRRNIKFQDGLKATFFDDVTTLYHAFQRGLRVNRKGPCMGYRPVDEEGNVGNYEWFTYEEVAEMVDCIGSGMLHEDLYHTDEEGMNMIGIYSRNRYEWNVVEQACNAYSGVVVPLYDTLGTDAVKFVLHQTNMKTVFCESKAIETLLASKRQYPEELSSFTVVVCFEMPTEDQTATASELGIRLLSFRDLLNVGSEHRREHIVPDPDAVCTFCYTSGTTGDPKGAMLTHKNIVADASAAGWHGLNFTPQDRHLSYLPLAHMFERVVQVAVVAHGGAIGYYQGSPLKLVDDLKALRPTIFPSVPRLFNKFYDKIMAGVRSKGGLAQAMFNKGYEAKRYWLRQNYLQYGFWDSLVFNKVKAQVGLDQCRLFATGSAPIADHVMEWIRIVFGVPIVEGYGQTECAAVATLTWPEDQASFGNVGAPLACNDVKLVSVPEMDYLVTDEHHNRKVEADGTVVSEGIRCLGRGEVCYRGPNVFRGYYKNPDKTAEALDSDGWLHSGDIGLFLPDGRLKIIDRKKNIFKLSQGEYVAAEKIENVYQTSKFVAQVFVHGDSLQSCLVAIVVPDQEYLEPWARENGIEGTFAELCTDDRVKDAIFADMNAVGKQHGLRGFEFAHAITLDSEVWTVENDLLTPTFKLKRNVAKERYQAAINAMYDSGISVVAGATGLRQGE